MILIVITSRILLVIPNYLRQLQVFVQAPTSSSQSPASLRVHGHGLAWASGYGVWVLIIDVFCVALKVAVLLVSRLNVIIEFILIPRACLFV
jgi:hypothetical protein